MSIKQYIAKIKGTEPQSVDTPHQGIRNDIFLILVIILIAFASFGLGRLSTVSSSSKERPMTFEPRTQSASVYTNNNKDTSISKTNLISGTYVASISGAKYHFPWCSGAQRIKEENKIWFNTVEDARAAGYTPAANCKGLE